MVRGGAQQRKVCGAPGKSYRAARNGVAPPEYVVRPADGAWRARKSYWAARGRCMALRKRYWRSAVNCDKYINQEIRL